MRNLQLRKRFVLDDRPTQPLAACAWDGDEVLCAYGPSKENPLLELRRWKPAGSSMNTTQTDDVHTITSFDAPCPLPDLECDKIISLYHLPEKLTVCLVLAGGDIILVREHPEPGEEKIEIVGSVDVGLTAAEWSPDGELLVLATRADTLLFMTREFENAVSAAFTEDDLKASKHVSVGWGKKETQFTGRGARALRDPTMPEKVDEGVRSPFDHDETTISWRGDGQVFAVNSRQASSRRVIRVYSREGVLDGVSEPVDNLEAALSWRPAGNLLASVQRHPNQENRADVVFFERNGLRHGDFKLRIPPSAPGVSDPTSMIRLKWNYDSSVLAICFADRIQLWTMGNYHYYLKQEILSDGDSKLHAPMVTWDSERPLRFALNTSLSAEVLHYSQVVLRSPTWYSQTGSVAVIDGDRLKLTALRYGNVPPPMSQSEIQFVDNIVTSAIYAADDEEIVATIDNKQLSVHRWNSKSVAGDGPTLVSNFDLYKSEDGRKHSFQQVVFVDRDNVAVLGNLGKTSSVRVLHLDRSLDPPILTEASNSTGLTAIAKLIAANTRHNLTIYTLDYEGNAVAADIAADTSSLDPDSFQCKLPKEADSVDVVRINTFDTPSSGLMGNGVSPTTVAFAMTTSGNLYANERCIARDCTSFVTTSSHLVYTTSKHLLKFIHLGSAEELVIPSDTPEVDERCRSVERGAKLVTIIPSTAAVILQMPRGNLETIFPRALVLAEIRRNIDDRKYKRAFLACRKQRVDMNIIVDYKPDQFFSDVPTFVEQVAKVEHIDLFLSQLRDEDVSATMYKDTLPKKEADAIEAATATRQSATGKVNRASGAFLAVLQDRSETHLQNIITAHVVKLPPDIDAGLIEVAKFQKMGEKEANRAVEHICFLVDVNKLFDNALGLYDLDLALLIAEKSQKDPREYLPFLQRLRDLPLLRRKFDIDNHLDRYKKALADLWELDVFSEYKSYTVTYDLYEDALLATRYEETKYREIMALYAEFLQKRSKFKEAGIAFEYLREYDNACENYQLASMWQESLSCAYAANYDDARLRSLANVMCDALVEHKSFHAAATIQWEFLVDAEASARLYCRGYHFAEAISLLNRQRKADKIAELVDTGLTESMGSTIEILADFRSQLKAQVPRIRELRVKKAEQPLAYYEGTNDNGADIPDNISLAATDASTMGGSLFTRYTGKNSGTIATNATRKTAKNKRKEERKRAQGKKGSVYEEEYLVNSVGRLIERVNSVSEDVERLVVGLMRRSMREQARAVEAAMQEVVQACSDCRNEVFQIEEEDRRQQAPDNHQSVEALLGSEPRGDAEQAQKQAKMEPPRVRRWEGLALVKQ